MKSMIIAKGKLYGVEMEISVMLVKDKLKLHNYGERSQLLQDRFDRLADEILPIGNYHPKRNSLLNAHNVLKNRFFDSEPDITTIGNIGTIPYKKGIIY